MLNSKSLFQKILTSILLGANMLVLALFVTGWPSSSSRAISQQGNGKLVAKERGPRNEPVEVTDLKIKGHIVGLGNGFEAESDWLKQLTFVLKNRGTAPVSYVRIDLDFPETKATGAIMMHQIYLGSRPDVESLSRNEPLNLEPDDSVTISLSSEYPGIKKLIELRQPPAENVNKIVIRLGEVMFVDGTLYSGGNLFKRNPDRDGAQKWIPTTSEPAN